MRINLFVALALSTLLFSSCSINKKAVRQTDNIAVISFTSNAKVKNNSNMQARLLTEARDLDTTVVDIANKIRVGFFNRNPKLISKVRRESEIINTEEFKDYIATVDQEVTKFEEIMFSGVDFVSPEGYPIFKYKNKKVMRKAFNYLPEDIDAVLMARTLYSFNETSTVNVGGFSSSGLGKQRVECNLIIYMINREGKKLISINITGISDDKLGSKSEEGTLNRLVDQALANSLEKFDKRLRKL